MSCQHEFGSSFGKCALTFETICQNSSGFVLFLPVYSIIRSCISYSLTFDRCEWKKKTPWKMRMAIIWSDQKCLLLWQWILIGLTFPRFSSFMIIDTWNPSFYLILWTDVLDSVQFIHLSESLYKMCVRIVRLGVLGHCFQVRHQFKVDLGWK